MDPPVDPLPRGKSLDSLQVRSIVQKTLQDVGAIGLAFQQCLEAGPRSMTLRRRRNHLLALLALRSNLQKLAAESPPGLLDPFRPVLTSAFDLVDRIIPAIRTDDGFLSYLESAPSWQTLAHNGLRALEPTKGTPPTGNPFAVISGANASEVPAATAALPFFKVSSWAELSIGLHRGRSYAFVPELGIGEQVTLSRGREVHIGGQQWPALTNLLADSDDHKHATIDAVMADFGYGAVRPFQRSDVDKREYQNQVKAWNIDKKTLNDAIKKLAERLRVFVEGPTGRGRSNLYVFGDNVRARFTTAALCEANGYFWFGKYPSR